MDKVDKGKVLSEDLKEMLREKSWHIYAEHIPNLKPYTLIPCPLPNCEHYTIEARNPCFMVYWNIDDKMWVHRCFCKCLTCDRFTGDQDTECRC